MKNRFNKLAYKEMVQKQVLLETFGKLYTTVIESEGGQIATLLSEAASNEFSSTLNFETDSARGICKRLNETGIEFTKKMVLLSESIAEKKSEDAAIAGVEEMPHKVEFSDIEKELIDNVFNDHLPEDAVEKVRDSVSNALYTENQRAEELRRASELVKQQNTDEEAINESIKLMGTKTPGTLMGAILTSVSGIIVNENSTLIENGASVGKIMADKKDEIKKLSMGTYAIYETMNTFGFKKYSKDDVERLTDEIAMA